MTKQYNEEQTSELTLYIENTGDIYRKHVIPIVNLLAKRIVKGNYDKTLAAVAFLPLVNLGAQMYCKEFCSSAVRYYDIFSLADRKETTERLLEGYIDFINETADKMRNSKEDK